MKEINHEVFGKIKYDHSWEGEKEVSFLGDRKKIAFVIKGSENAEFENAQIVAFEHFFNSFENLILLAQSKIFDYYNEVCEEYRKMLGESANELAPLIMNVKELNNLIELKELIFIRSRGKDIRKVGILYECTWEEEHGLAVKFENEKVVDVGYQDIVL